MADTEPSLAAPGRSPRLDAIVKNYPHAPLIAPFFAFLILMVLDQVLPDSWRTLSYAMRSVGGLWVAWLFRGYLPKLGRPHLLIAIPLGLIVAFGWVEVHHWFAGCTHHPCRMQGLLGITHAFPGFAWYRDNLCFDANPNSYFNPHTVFDSTWALWLFLIVRIGGASISVPVVEELFWRGFMLRALIKWHDFQDVPMATFTWGSYLGTALLSGIQHQPQWEVGILCWLVYNALFYWKRSLTCCMVTHGVTNLALYIYVFYSQDWRFW
jgi:membrane protease YdiL (CAAX protease family)